MKIINGQRVYTLDFTEQHLAVLQEGLMMVPYGRAAVVVNAINEQLRPREAPPNTDSELMNEHHNRYGNQPP